jgi:hypothetical protein
VTSLAGLLLISPERSERAGGAGGADVVEPAPTGAGTASADVFVALAAGFSSTTSSG